MAERTSTGLIATLVILGLLAAGGAGYLYWQNLLAQREARAVEEIRAFSDPDHPVGRSYARTLLGIEALRAQFRVLLAQNPQAPPSRLGRLRDEATLSIITANGLGGDLDQVIAYAAQLETCIADQECDAAIATGHQSPLTALKNWEQWYRPYVEQKRNDKPEVATDFYGYVGRQLAAPAVS